MLSPRVPLFFGMMMIYRRRKSTIKFWSQPLKGRSLGQVFSPFLFLRSGPIRLVCGCLCTVPRDRSLGKASRWLSGAVERRQHTSLQYCGRRLVGSLVAWGSASARGRIALIIRLARRLGGGGGRMGRPPLQGPRFSPRPFSPRPFPPCLSGTRAPRGPCTGRRLRWLSGGQTGEMRREMAPRTRCG